MTSKDEKLTLRVLAGPRAGAHMPIVPGRPMHIGFAIGNDVVIRDPSSKLNRVALSLDHPGARLSVLEGEVRLLGVTLMAGQTVRLPKLVPFSLGETQIAFGPKDDSGWSGCTALLERPRATEGDATPGVQAASADGPGGDGPDSNDVDLANEEPRPRMPLWLTRLFMPVGLATLLVGYFLFAPSPVGSNNVVSRGLDTKVSPERLGTWLGQNGFPNLTVSRGGNEVPVITGFLDDESSRVRLSQAVSESGLRVNMNVSTGDQLAQAAANVFRTNGMDATAKYVGEGKVDISVKSADPASARRVEAIAQRDVPGLKGTTVRIESAPKRPTEFVRDDPNKRVVNVVYGRRGYVTTADGARYFVGALLPTGHQIADITDREVMLRKDGINSRLMF